MRIISGKLKGRIINPPGNLPARPTTDFAKTGLFNILNNYLEFEGLEVLDLFSGTGNIAFEFASRGAKHVTCVEKDSRCFSFIRKEIDKLSLTNMNVLRSDVYDFLGKTHYGYDLLFADPPYDTDDAVNVHAKVYEKKILRENGLFIIEHSERQSLSHLEHFQEVRKYGAVRFSFFGN